MAKYLMKVIVISDDVYSDLYGKLGFNNVPYQTMLKKPSIMKDYYTGDIILASISDWLNNK